MEKDGSSGDEATHVIGELIQSFLPEFLILVAPRVANRLRLEHGEFLGQDSWRDLREDDVLYSTSKLAGRSVEVLIHIESDAPHFPDFDHRMARYGLSLFRVHGVPVLPVVVFVQRGSEPGRREIYARAVKLDAAGFWFNWFRYLAVAISAGRAETYLRRGDPLSATLAALMPYGGGSRVEHKLCCFRKIIAAKELAPKRRSILVGAVDCFLPLEGREEEEFQAQISGDVQEEVHQMERFLEQQD